MRFKPRTSHIDGSCAVLHTPLEELSALPTPSSLIWEKGLQIKKNRKRRGKKRGEREKTEHEGGWTTCSKYTRGIDGPEPV